MRISDWSSDVCSSDLSLLKAGADREQLEVKVFGGGRVLAQMTDVGKRNIEFVLHYLQIEGLAVSAEDMGDIYPRHVQYFPASGKVRVRQLRSMRSEEHTSELQSLMRISYAVFC